MQLYTAWQALPLVQIWFFDGGPMDSGTFSKAWMPGRWAALQRPGHGHSPIQISDWYPNPYLFGYDSDSFVILCVSPAFLADHCGFICSLARHFWRRDGTRLTFSSSPLRSLMLLCQVLRTVVQLKRFSILTFSSISSELLLKSPFMKRNVSWRLLTWSLEGRGRLCRFLLQRFPPGHPVPLFQHDLANEPMKHHETSWNIMKHILHMPRTTNRAFLRDTAFLSSGSPTSVLNSRRSFTTLRVLRVVPWNEVWNISKTPKRRPVFVHFWRFFVKFLWLIYSCYWNHWLLTVSLEYSNTEQCGQSQGGTNWNLWISVVFFVTWIRGAHHPRLARGSHVDLLPGAARLGAETSLGWPACHRLSWMP